MRTLLAVALVGALTGPADALSIYCSSFRDFSDRIERPELPSCLDSLGMYTEDEWMFESCRSEMERHRSEVQDYIRCLEEEAGEAADELSNAIDRFNCYASGQSFCY